MSAWYHMINAATVDTPALVVYPDRVKKNLEILKTFVDDPERLRPHVKTNKCPEVIKFMLAAGLRQFKAATIAEAEMLASVNARDVLLAYQPVGPKAARFCALQKQYPATLFSCLTDNGKSLDALSAAAGEANTTARVFIDLNAGMNRTGIAPGAEAFALYRQARQTPNIEFAGLHAYDGHIRDTDLHARTGKCEAAFRDILALRDEISRDMGATPTLVAGGTPTFPIHAKRPGVVCSPGTFIFWDRGYQQTLPEQPFIFAALVLTRVISKPTENTICTDLGHKSIAAENPLSQRVYFLNAPSLVPLSQSEEHLVLKSAEKISLEVGDVLYGVPHHICPTVALYDEAAVSRDHIACDTWPIAGRKRKINI